MKRNTLKGAWIVASNLLRRWVVLPRIWIVAIFAFLWMYHELHSIRSFADAASVPVTPWSFPFAFTNWHNVLVVVLMEVLLFCDAPFMNEQTPYECIRCGKWSLLIGKQIYIWIGAFIFAVFLWLMSLLCMVPDLEWSWQWGRVIKTLAYTDAGSVWYTPLMPTMILRDYAPYVANIICVLLVALQAVFVGTVMFVLNSITRMGGWGVVGGIVLAMILGLESPVLGYIPKPLLQHFIPTGWIDMGRIALTSQSSYPTYGYIFGFFALFMAFLYFLTYKMYRHKEIAVSMPV